MKIDRKYLVKIDGLSLLISNRLEHVKYFHAEMNQYVEERYIMYFKFILIMCIFLTYIFSNF